MGAGGWDGQRGGRTSHTFASHRRVVICPEQHGDVRHNVGRKAAVSSSQHRLASVLGFASARVKDETTDLKRKRCPFEVDAHDERLEKQVRLQRTNAHTELQRMMQKELSFHSAQVKAMTAVQRGDSPIIAVMSTGAGKIYR